MIFKKKFMDMDKSIIPSKKKSKIYLKILVQSFERDDFLPCAMPDNSRINDLLSEDFPKHTLQNWVETASSENEGKNPEESLAWKVRINDRKGVLRQKLDRTELRIFRYSQPKILS